MATPEWQNHTEAGAFAAMHRVREHAAVAVAEVCEPDGVGQSAGWSLLVADCRCIMFTGAFVPDEPAVHYYCKCSMMLCKGILANKVLQQASIAPKAAKTHMQHTCSALAHVGERKPDTASTKSRAADTCQLEKPALRV